MKTTADPSRRTFLKATAALSGGLVIAFWLPGRRGLARAQGAPKAPIPPNAFLRIAKDGTVTVMVKNLEFGQGVTTALPMLVAEELECDWSRVRAELAPAAPEYAHTAFGMQMTGGSMSVGDSWMQLRTVGAQARTMLVGAAAAQWKVKPEACRAEKGFVIGPGGKKASFGSLAEAAAKLPAPEKVALKDPKQFKLIGKPTRRLDGVERIEAKTVFGLDVKRPGLHTALVAHPPVVGARVAKFDAQKVRGIAGVTHVVQTSRGVAVVAKNFWAAKKGRDALEIEWDAGPGATLSTEGLRAEYAALAKQPGPMARKAADSNAIKAAAKTVVAEYEVPFLAHAPMEPLNCTVEYRGDSAEVWCGSQFQTVDQAAAAKAMGLTPDKVVLHTMPAGGGFGRRANPASDYVVEACEIAKSVKVPVKTVWTREDDVRGGYYRPMYVHRVETGLDAKGAIVGWNHAIVGQSIIAGTAFEPFMVKDGIDHTSVEGVSDTPYDIPNMAVTLHSPKSPVTTLWWRSVGHSHTAFVMETMMDELAAAAGEDPLAFRRRLLAKHPRVVATLDLAARKAGWGSALPKGRARGIAVHESFGSVCAQVAEVSLEKGEVKVHRVVAAFDCGLVVNPMTVEAQVQGAIAFGLSAALHSAITIKDGKVQQSNFHDYRVLRLSEMPKVEVHIVSSAADKPTGVGEPATPPIAPAVANALFALTGKRARSLPLGSLGTVPIPS
ncbi:MAG TPA: xanthine dehydrogenase family protein molybdopterin-binding subunit [Usitatibacteraceae bacterium]|nr:xanthine dehydrogenase family protein molybdopterin-binding subunit [Usitatibacteraceae bacterium]